MLSPGYAAIHNTLQRDVTDANAAPVPLLENPVSSMQKSLTATVGVLPTWAASAFGEASPQGLIQHRAECGTALTDVSRASRGGIPVQTRPAYPLTSHRPDSSLQQAEGAHTQLSLSMRQLIAAMSHCLPQVEPCDWSPASFCELRSSEDWRA